jgi:hypothetical protein
MYAMSKKRASQFVKNFVAALGHCLLEECEVLGPVLIVLSFVGVLWLAFATLQFAYEIIWDPTAADVAARLASLSIDPSKWI